jgi:hypothetical protein
MIGHRGVSKHTDVTPPLLAPANTSPPVVTGAITEGSTLSVSDGTWANAPVPPYAYQWYYNSVSSTSGGTILTGEIAATYVAAGASVGNYVYCRVTATNATGSTAAFSNVVGPISATVFSGLTAPSLDYPTAPNPPTIGIHIPADWQTGNVLKLDRSQDVTFATGVSTLSHTIIDADTVPGATITLTIPTLTGSPWYFRAHGAAVTDANSNIVAWGDAVAPTITTSATANITETLPLAVALTANETIGSWAITGGADQLQFEISGTTLRWYANGSQSYASPLDAGANNVYDVTVSATDLAGNITAKAIAVTVIAADLTPNSFTFASITGAARSSTVNSAETITLAGLEPSFNVAISVSGCKYSKNGGTFTNVTGSVRNGDTIQLQDATSANYETPTIGSVTVGTYTTTFQVTTLQDPANVSWTPESPPPAQNIAFGANSATFTNINFGAGMGVVFVASSDRDITGVTVGGSAMTLTSKSSVAAKEVSMWQINIASGGLKSVVVSAGSSLKHVAIATGTMTPTSQTATATATPKAYGYTADPQALASITVPANGIALCALTSENVSNTITWGTGTQETNVVEGVTSDGVRLTTARLRTTGAFSLTGLSTQGSAMVAAAWGL